MSVKGQSRGWIVVALFALCHTVWGAQPDGASGIPDLIQRVDSTMQHWQQDKRFSAAAVAIVDDIGVLLSKGYGEAQVGGRPVNGNSSQFMIGSVSKVITASALMQLVDTGLIDSLDDPAQVGITRLTPGLDAAKDNTGQSVIAIRGIYSTVGTATTGIYIDDTPIQVRFLGAGGVAGSAFPTVFDLERIEVLRGPQDTLFGSGSEGGTVRFITLEPNLTQWSGHARSELAWGVSLFATNLFDTRAILFTERSEGSGLLVRSTVPPHTIGVTRRMGFEAAVRIEKEGERV